MTDDARAAEIRARVEAEARAIVDKAQYRVNVESTGTWSLAEESDAVLVDVITDALAARDAERDRLTAVVAGLVDALKRAGGFIDNDVRALLPREHIACDPSCWHFNHEQEGFASVEAAAADVLGNAIRALDLSTLAASPPGATTDECVHPRCHMRDSADRWKGSPEWQRTRTNTSVESAVPESEDRESTGGAERSRRASPANAPAPPSATGAGRFHVERDGDDDSPYDALVIDRDGAFAACYRQQDAQMIADALNRTPPAPAPDARGLLREAVAILLACHHGDEATCGCRARAEALLALAARPDGGSA